MSVVDDYGRYYGTPAAIRGACWPTAPNRVKESDVTKWLAELTRGERPLVRLYDVTGCRFLEITDFGQQVRSASKFPDNPDGSSARKRPMGFIYFIQSAKSKKIKIGFTELTPESRLAVLQTGSAEELSLLGSTPGTMDDERAIHKKFAIHREHGEWFFPHNDLKDFLLAECGKLPQVNSTSRSRISESKAKADTKSESEACMSPDSNFDSFWKSYPRKDVGPSKAKEAFLKHPQLWTDPLLFQAVMRSLELFKQSSDWTKQGGEFIPMATTWLNQKRWEGEVRDGNQGNHSDKTKRNIGNIARGLGLEEESS